MRQSQRCHLRHSDYCSPSAVSVLMCTDGPCVLKAFRLQSWKDFNIQWYEATPAQSSDINNSSNIGLESGSGSGSACVSMCAPVIPNKDSHSWGVAVVTGVALLNQYQYEHAHLHSNPVKAGRVWQTGMLNRPWMERLGATMVSTHRQAYIGSRIRRRQAGKCQASTYWDRRKRKKKRRGNRVITLLTSY